MVKQKKILIADDDQVIMDALGAILEFEGYEVVYSVNGASLQNMKNEFPDLLLLDIWMSGIDGRDICKEFKQKENTKNIPIVLISASREIERSALEAGADDFLAKPFEMDDLLKTIEKHLH